MIRRPPRSTLFPTRRSSDLYRNFMLHYNFPPFSVGEARPLRSPGRREIGHGALAERALKPVLPSKRSEEHTSELQSLAYLVCRLLLEKKKIADQPEVVTIGA